MKDRTKLSFFFIILIFASLTSLHGQGQSKIETTILSSGFYIKEFQLSYLPKSENNDIYSLNLDKFQFEFSNVNFNSWHDNITMHPTLEFIGPKVSLQKLTLSAELYKPDWITNEKLKRMNKRQSIPKLGAEAINQAIILYKIDQGQLPSSMNELIVKNYITLSNKPFNNALWNYSLDLPKQIIAKPSKYNPIPKENSIIYDFTLKKFLTDPVIDSLERVPFLRWFYKMEINGVNINSSTKLDIKYNKSDSDFSLIMEHGDFEINDVSFTALPGKKIKDKTIISLGEFSIDCRDLILDGNYDSTLIFYKGEGQFRIEDLEIKIPEGLGKEPEFEAFLHQIGVWNNSVSIRLAEAKIKMINQFTGSALLKVHTPFIKAVFNGNLSFRQENIKTPEIRFHNAELTIHPIALGIKKWIRNWEKTKRISLKRKGPAVVIKLNGSLNRLDLNSLKNITIF